MFRTCRLVLGVLFYLCCSLTFATGPDSDPDVQPAPEFRSFPKDLGKNLIGLFSRENLAPLLLGAGAAAASRSVDRPVRRWFGNVDDDVFGREKSRFGNVEEVGETLGAAWVVGSGIGGMMLLNRFTDSPRLRSFTYDAAQGFVLNHLVTSGLKYTLRRQRPDQSNRRSFPSGHTSTLFTLASIAGHHYGPKVGIPAYLTASMVGMSRLEEGTHFLSDVVAGATLGYIVGQTVVRRSRPSRFHYFPVISSKDRIYGLTLSASF